MEIVRSVSDGCGDGYEDGIGCVHMAMVMMFLTHAAGWLLMVAVLVLSTKQTQERTLSPMAASLPSCPTWFTI